MTIKATLGIEFEIAFEGTVSGGCAETGPSYSSGGSPAEPPETEVTSITAVNFDSYVFNPKTKFGGIKTFNLLDGLAEAERVVFTSLLEKALLVSELAETMHENLYEEAASQEPDYEDYDPHEKADLVDA